MDTVWFLLFVATAVTLVVVLIISLGGYLYAHRREEILDPQGREVYISYNKPDYTNSAGFRIERFPRTEILIPQAYWLINDSVAEVRYNVVPDQCIRLRLAESGKLLCPTEYEAVPYQSSIEYTVDGITVHHRQIAGEQNIISWSRNGFDFILYAATPQMNTMGGIIDTFVSRMEIIKSE